MAAAALGAPAGLPVWAGTASVPIVVKVQFEPRTGSQCRGSGDPLSLACGILSSSAMTALGPSGRGGPSDQTFVWTSYASAIGGGRDYTASLSRRAVTSADGQAYIETLVIW